MRSQIDHDRLFSDSGSARSCSRHSERCQIGKRNLGSPRLKNAASEAPLCQVRAGYARIGRPVAVRVDAPEKPEIVLTPEEAESGITYEVVGRRFQVLVSDRARGDCRDRIY
ncbi:MAG: hypothetical protein U5L00_18880 [Desulfovermiculus sp.]|nr:hypothetical protein [Desulfovermiculus sp.]